MRMHNPGQMHNIEPVEPTQLRQVVSQLGRKEIGVIEAVEVVSIGPGVQRHPRLPIRQVNTAPVGIHRPLPDVSWLQDFMSSQPLADYVHRYQPITDSHTELITSGGPRDPHRRTAQASRERLQPARTTAACALRAPHRDQAGILADTRCAARRPTRSRVRRPGIAMNGLVAGASLFCRRRRGFDGDQLG
jgi:hypothetical protein